MNNSEFNQESNETTPVSGAVDNKNVENASGTSEVNATMTTLAIVPKTEDNTEKTALDEKKEEKQTFAPLSHLDIDFVYELMAIPTLSKYEYRLVTFIMLWAKKNHIKYEFDSYGNLYLTKGTIKEGEYYPCMTAHLDSVQQKHKAYIQAGAELEVLTRIVKEKREIYIDGMGIGGDDKAGVLIGLSMFNHCDTLKAAFFLEEEIGCCGSKSLNEEWFKNVGYVLGYDSPDLNRAAWSCSGTKLFSAKFFKEHMQEICKEHGLTKFYSEPFTDVKQIREKTNVMCMNFGSGYYNGHMENEYCVIEEMDSACKMGHALIEHLGKTRHELEHKEKSYTWTKLPNGGYQKPEEEDDEIFLRTLGDSSKYSGAYGSTYRGNGAATYGGGNVGGYQGGARYGEWDDEDDYGYGRAYTPNNRTNVSNIANGGYTSPPAKKEDEVNIETVRYIYEKYDNHIENLKKSVESKCKELNIDFTSEFAKIFENTIKF